VCWQSQSQFFKKFCLGIGVHYFWIYSSHGGLRTAQKEDFAALLHSMSQSRSFGPAVLLRPAAILLIVLKLHEKVQDDQAAKTCCEAELCGQRKRSLNTGRRCNPVPWHTSILGRTRRK
jgi:hypothetical protein